MKLRRFVPILMLFVVLSSMAQSSGKTFDEIEYNARTRGTHISIKVNKDKVLYKGNYGNKEVDLTKEQLAKLGELVKGLNLEAMSSLKAPSQKRMTDGALHGDFVVKVGGAIYKSSTFDAGNAPKELKPLEEYLNELIGGVD